MPFILTILYQSTDIQLHIDYIMSLSYTIDCRREVQNTIQYYIPTFSAVATILCVCVYLFILILEIVGIEPTTVFCKEVIIPYTALSIELYLPYKPPVTVAGLVTSLLTSCL